MTRAMLCLNPTQILGTTLSVTQLAQWSCPVRGNARSMASRGGSCACTLRRPQSSRKVYVKQGPDSSATSADPLQGQITTDILQSMRQKISDDLNAEDVQVIDVNGDGRHVSIDVISTTFEGLSSVKRQRMVYKAIWQELSETVHAVDAMTTKTPAEAGL